MSKNYIKEKLDGATGEYTIKQFDEMAELFHKNMKDSDYDQKKIKTTMARYSTIKNNKIIFNTKEHSEMNYKDLKDKMEKVSKSSFLFNMKLNSKDSRHNTTGNTKSKKKSDTDSEDERPKKISKKQITTVPTKPSTGGGFLHNLALGNDKEGSQPALGCTFMCDLPKQEKQQKIKSNKESDTDESDNEEYVYSLDDNIYQRTKKYPPFGTQWVHDHQVDDVLDTSAKRRVKIFREKAKLKFPAQKSLEWLALRMESITASDAGCTLGENTYEPPHKILIKKVLSPPFEPNANCYHGNKYEQIATMIYGYRTGVTVREFGVLKHPTCKFLAASPDGIVSEFKFDGKSLTKNVGRMLEIKCLTSRTFNITDEIKGGICPIYYWDQVQLQLECLDLDDCDFWQCKITEYESRDEFINDTDKAEPFRSKTYGFEKGVIIQVLPLSKRDEAQGVKLKRKKSVDDKDFDLNPTNLAFFEEVENGEDADVNKEKYLNIVYEFAKHIYPPKIEMTPCECDQWTLEVMQNFHKQELLDEALNIRDYYVDKIIYWKLEHSHCALIERDKVWFAEVLPKLGLMWSYVEYLRANKDKSDILFSYIESVTEKEKIWEKNWNKNKPTKYRDKKMKEGLRDKIMKVVDDICTDPDKKDKSAIKKYTSRIIEIQDNTVKNKEIKKYNENKRKDQDSKEYF